MNHSGLDFQEVVSSQLPALQLLVNMGYTYLNPIEALEVRAGRKASPFLNTVLIDSLERLNRVHYKAQVLPFAPENITKAAEKLTRLPYEALYTTAQKYYDLLTLGTSLEQVIDGDKKSYSLKYIDFEHPENNVYHVTEEFALERLTSSQTRRPDIVVFVNGIPLAVIECKRPDLKDGLDQAVAQHLRNQQAGEIPHLSCIAQLLIGVTQNAAKYGTTATDRKFWGDWREENADFHSRLPDLVNAPLAAEVAARMLEWREPWIAAQIRGTWKAGGRAASPQDALLHSLLDKNRLLELIRGFIVFDAGTKKVARYQQFFAIGATVERVSERVKLAETDSGDSSIDPSSGLPARRGGVIWHTTGSGKSLTMVMLAKALTVSGVALSPKVILVTDRIDLDEQIRDTFKNCGAEVVQASSGKNLYELVQSSKATVITTLIDKFEAVSREKFKDASADIFILVDESHRSQYGTANALMNTVFPNACYLGFTGTPLLKKEKSTAQKFGGFIHKYTMPQAVADGAVAPLKYEGRYSELRGAAAQLDKWFERVTRTLTDQQRADLKRKFTSAEPILEAKERMSEVAFDIGQHFRSFVSGKDEDKRTGLKGQFAVSSKLMAVRYKKLFDSWGEVSAAVIMSAPDTREDHSSVDESDVPEVQAFWRDMMARYGSEKVYQRSIIDSFKGEGDPEILIVVDKLLTGFDAPRNTVLYLDKRLKEHNVLQAIARVNRVFDGKEYGLIVDYRGIFGELTDAMELYAALEAEGFDLEDIEDALVDVSVELAMLPTRHTHVWDVFKGVTNRSDPEAMQLWLYPQDRRDAFYEALSHFVNTLRLALSTAKFLEDAPEDIRKRYVHDLRYFLNLRAAVKQRYGEAIDYSVFEKQIRNLIAEHVGADTVRTLIAPVSIFDREALELELATLEGTAARADVIASRIKRVATERLEEDPTFFKRLSQLVEEAIEAYRAQRMNDLEYLKTVEDLLEQTRNKGQSDLPAALHQRAEAAAYYGLFGEQLNDEFKNLEKAPDLFIEMALEFQRLLGQHKIRDWERSESVRKRMMNDLDDYLFALEQQHEVRIPFTVRDDLFEKVIQVALHYEYA